MLDEKRIRNLINNNLRFCPLCNRLTIQRKVLNISEEFYCMSCGNVFKGTKPITDCDYEEDEFTYTDIEDEFKVVKDDDGLYKYERR